MAGRPQHQVPRRTVAAMALLYVRDRWSLAAIGTRYGLSVAVVRRRLDAHGVRMRGRGRPPSNDTATVPEWHARAMQLRLEGLHHHAIAAELGKSPGVVRQTLSRIRRASA